MHRTYARIANSMIRDILRCVFVCGGMKMRLDELKRVQLKHPLFAGLERLARIGQTASDGETEN